MLLASTLTLGAISCAPDSARELFTSDLRDKISEITTADEMDESDDYDEQVVFEKWKNYLKEN